MHITLSPGHLFVLFGFPITNTLLMTWVAMSLISGFAFLASRKLELVPHGFQNGMEAFVEGALDFIEPILGSRKDAVRFFPLVITFFLLIIVSNWLELLPGLHSVGIYEEIVAEGHAERVFISFLRSPSSDLNFTLALALISVVVTQISGIAAIGFFKYGSRYISLKSPVDFFVGLLELISEVAKIISFSFRLFGNIFAGEVLLIVMGVLVPAIIPLPFLALELFVGFVQALVFSMLTVVFLKIATSSH